MNVLNACTRAAICGHGEAHPDSDECPDCLYKYEAGMAEMGETEAPCKYGHYFCAHKEGGDCHPEMRELEQDCSNPLCVWRE